MRRTVRPSAGSANSVDLTDTGNRKTWPDISKKAVNLYCQPFPAQQVNATIPASPATIGRIALSRIEIRNESSLRRWHLAFAIWSNSP